MKKRSGFTLIELMIVLVVIAVFAAIAVPSYQAYIQKKDLALAKQEALKMASELERFKNKNFSYKGLIINLNYLTMRLHKHIRMCEYNGSPCR